MIIKRRANLFMKTNPLVSVCIPTYNRENSILSAIDCATSQTYKNIEILISDNCSTDKTIEAIKKIKDPRIRLIVQKKNLGMIPNWNFCINEAKGEYIKFLHSDDLIDSKCVEEELNFFLNNGGISLVTCKRNFIDEDDNLLYSMQFSNKTCRESGEKYGRWMITNIRENRVGEPSAVMFRKSDAQKAGLFDIQYSQLADFEFWIRLHTLGDIGYINIPLCFFRMHKGSNTTAAIKDGRFIDETFVFIEKYYSNQKYRKVFNLSKKDQIKTTQQKTLDFLNNIKILFISGDIKTAKVYLDKLLKHVTVSSVLLDSINHLMKK